MALPSVTIVFLAFNRREELRESLRRMLFESDYEGEVDVIVVDNASTDGTAAMVREEFPRVELIVRSENVGVSGWNEGFAAARGDYVLALDDDCYLLPDGLRLAVEGATEHDADLVSFRVVSTHDLTHFFSDMYRTGLFGFWGCACLVRRPVLQELGGYDPEIFMWANEMELTIRFLDRGHRHLFYPRVVGQHMKEPLPEMHRGTTADHPAYRINARHWAYIAAKLLRPRHAAGALVARLGQVTRDVIRDGRPVAAYYETARGFAHGLRHRRPVRGEVSALYRHECETFVGPWRKSRPLGEVARGVPSEGRWHEFFDSRPDLYPEDEPRTLSL